MNDQTPAAGNVSSGNKSGYTAFSQKKYVALVFLMIGVFCGNGLKATTYYSRGTGNWNAAATWSTVNYNGEAASSYPTSLDAANIYPGHTVTVTATAACSALYLVNGGGNQVNGSAVLNINSNITLTVTNEVQINGPNFNGAISNTINVNSGTLSAASIYINWGNWEANTSSITVSTGTINCTGGIGFQSPSYQTGAINFTFTGAGTLNLGGDFGTSGTFSAGTSTVNCNGTTAQTITANNYNILKINNSAGVLLQSNCAIKTLIIGDVVDNSLFLDAGATITPTSPSTLNLSKGSRYKIGSQFGTGTWPGWATTTMAAGTTVEYYSEISQTLSSPQPSSYPNLIFSGSGTKTLGVNISVDGNLTVDGGSTLDLSTYTANRTTTGGTLTVSGNLIVGGSTGGKTGSNFPNNFTNYTSSGETVNYDYAGAQTIANLGYNNLKLSGSGAKTFPAALACENVSIGIGAYANMGTFTTTTNTLTLAEYGQHSSTWGGTGSAATYVYPSYFSDATGLLTVSGSSYTAGTWVGVNGTDWATASNWCDGNVPASSTNVVIPAGGNQPVIGAAAVCSNITINSGATLAITGSNTLTVSGNWSNNGTFTPNSSTVLFNGSGAQTIGGSSAGTFSTLKVNNTTGVTLGAAQTITTLTIGDVTANSIFSDGGYVITPGAGSVLNLTSGTYNLGAATATTWPAWGTRNMAVGTTIGYTSSAAQTVSAIPAYQNLTLGSSAKTLTGLTSIAGNLTLNWTITLPSGFTVGGNLINNGGLFITSNATVAGNFSGTGYIGYNGVTNVINVGGDWSFNGSSVYPINAIFNGTGSQTLTGVISTNNSTRIITVNKASGTLTLGANFSLTSFVMTQGTFDPASYKITSNGSTFTAGTLRVVSSQWSNNYSFTPTIPSGFTIEYSGGAQTIANNITYQNLTLSGSGAKTFPSGTTTVNGLLSVENGASANTFTGSLAYGSGATLQYNSTSARTASTEWPSTFSGTGGVIIKNTGAVTLDGAKTIGAGLSLASGSTVNLGTYSSSAASLTLAGNAQTNNATYGGTGSPAANINTTYFAANTGILISGSCPTYSLTTTSVASAVFIGSTATVNLTADASALPTGVYSVTYNLSGSNSATGSTSSMTVSTAGQGSFATAALSNKGSTTLTITALTKGCVSSIATNNTASITTFYPIAVTSTEGTASESYSTLKNAFNAINAGTHKGEITITINFNTTETSTATLYQSGYNNTSSYTLVNIYPTVSGLSITGDLATPLIELNGADNVTINGSLNGGNTGKDLTITNLSTSNSSGTSTIRFINDATSNSVKYCTIKGASTSSADGIVNFSTTTATTGNDNNIIENNNLTNSTDDNRPLNVIHSLGTSAKLNSGNKIRYNNFYNFFSRSNSSAGIYLSDNNTDWTIGGNSFYETTSFAATAGYSYTVINVSASSALGNNFTVSNNFIGGSDVECGGSAWTKTNTKNNQFTAIRIYAGTSSASNIQGNIIKNFSYSNSGSASWYGINAYYGLLNIGTTSGNTIGSSSGTGSITFTAGEPYTYFYGMFLYSSTGATFDCQNNLIGSITLANANSTDGCDFYGIYKEYSGGIINISNNTIGSTATSSSINMSSASTSSGQYGYGIWSRGTGSITISGNTIANIVNATTSSTGTLNGIYTQEIPTSMSISGNTIRDLSTSSGHTNYSGSVSGMYLRSQASVTGNIIYNLSNTSSDFAGYVNGIISAPDNSTGALSISGNFIHDLSVNASASAATIQGLYFGGGASSTTSVSNNIITLSGNTSTTIYGLFENGSPGTIWNIYFNTVSVYGSPTSGSRNSAAFYSYGSYPKNTRNIKNNIFVNARSNSGASGTHYAMQYNSTDNGITAEYNNYYVTGSGGVLGYVAGNKTSLPFLDGKDAGSLCSNPVFTHAGGNAATDYLPSNASLIGATGTGVSKDYANTDRVNNSMGAYDYVVNNPTIQVIATSGTTTASYNQLKPAFDNINNGTHKGDITIKINGSSNEAASAVLNASGTGSADYNLVNIYPTASDLTISSNLASPLIDLNGADHVTIDGRVNGSGTSVGLTISNTSTSGTAGTSAIRFINDASGNIIQYCNLKGSSTVYSGGIYTGTIVLFSTTDQATGNDNNTISHNNITSASNSNRPYNAIYSLGTDTKTNSGNVISNNNIFNFISFGGKSYGVNLSGYNTDWTITENSFYETTSFIPTDSREYRCINIENTSGNNFTVTSNFIGGSASECGGSAWTKSNAQYNDFTGIYLSVGTSAASSVQGNVIRNFYFENSVSAGSSWYGIKVAAGNVNIGTAAGNTIGSSTGTGSVKYSSDNWATVYGICLTTTGVIDCQDNAIGSITAGNSNSANAAYFFGIYKSATAGATTISNNTIGSTSQASSINASSLSTGIAQSLYGIYSDGTGTVTVSGNVIANLTNSSTNSTASTKGYINGIYINGGTTSIVSGNTVRDLSNANANNAATYDASVIGINLKVATASVTSNTVYNLSNLYSSFTGYVIGIYNYSNSNIARNFIHSLSVNGSTTNANINGIRIISGTSTYSNNIISLGGNTETTVCGIYEPGIGGNNNLYYNTIYISGTPTSGSKNSYALWNNTNSNTLDFRNNILMNARSNNGASGKHYAMYIVTSGGTITSNYNDYYTPGTGGVLGYYGADKSTLPIVTGATGNDLNSKNIQPGFSIAGGGNSSDYLPSEVSLSAPSLSGITTDFSGATRNKLSIGAYDYSVNSVVLLTATSGTLSSKYFSLKDAFDAINGGIAQGIIDISINSGTNETAGAILYHSGYNSTSNYTSVNIYPTVTGLTISGNLAAPLIDLNGADNVTINGSLNGENAGKNLTITNTSTSATSGTSTIRMYNGANSNTIKYCTIKGSGTDASGGVIFLSATAPNTGNIIDNNNITNAADANRPVNAIYSGGAANTVTISNNNIYDFLSRGSSSNGINLNSSTAASTISGNSFYETNTFSPTANRAYYNPIYINSSAAGFMISGNYIGGNAPLCSGTWIKANTAYSNLCAINLVSVGTGTPSVVKGNTVNGITWNNNTNDNATMYGILISSGDVTLGVSGEPNTIGSITGTPKLTFNSDNSGSLLPIVLNGSGYITCQYNNIGGITCNNTNSTQFTRLYCISRWNNNASGIISNNTIGSSTNPISCTSSSTGDVQWIVGIENLGGASTGLTINDNSISYLNNSSTNSGWVSGIHSYEQAIALTASGNSIHDLTIANTANGSGRDASVRGGIWVSSCNTFSITNNTVYNLTNTNTSFNGYIYGIYCTGGSDVNDCSGNTVYNLSATGTGAGPVIFGIYFSGYGVVTKTVNTIKRNYVYGFSSSGVNTNYSNTKYYGIYKQYNTVAVIANNIVNFGGNNISAIYGIYEEGHEGCASTLFFNTVYISGSPTSGSLNSYALYSANSNTRTFKNNVLYNARSNNGATGTHSCIYYGATAANSDYNDLYAPGSNGCMGYFNGNAYSAIAGWRTITGREANSLNTNPSFASAGGTPSASYIPYASALVAVTGTGIDTDYAGTIRNPTVPSIGAYEYTLPSLAATTSATAITMATATSGGEVLSDCGASITARGVCWGTSQNPLLSVSNYTSNGTGTGSFTSSITGLTAGTTYYVRAYATNSIGTGYGTGVSFTTSKTPSSVTATGTTTFTYNGSSQGPASSEVTGSTGVVTYSYSGSGNTTYNASSTAPVNAGTYQVIASVASDANYSSATSSALAFIISKVELTITAGNQTINYGTAASSVTSGGTYTPTGFVNSESSSVINGSATYTTTYTATTQAATSGVTITPVVTNLTATNYTFTPASGPITIGIATSVITAKGTTTLTYNGSAQGPASAEVTGSTGAVTYIYSGTGATTYGASSTAPANAGSYQVLASVAADANFSTATSSALAFTISKVELTITAENQTVNYGTTVSTVTFGETYTPTGLVNSESSSVINGSVTYTTTYTATTPVATSGVTITPVVTNLTATNYTFTPAGGIITIGFSTSAITAKGTTTFTYNGSSQGPASSDVTGSTGVVTYSYSGSGNTTYDASSTAPANAGTYQVIASVAADANYNSASSSAFAFTINKALLTIASCTAQNKTYNGNNTAVLTGTLAGVINSDDVTLSLSGTFASSDAASAITVTSTSTLGGTKAVNYTLTQPTGLTADITKASQTITFGELSAKSVGDADSSPGATTGSGLIISYTSSNSQVVTILNGQIHIIGAGTTNITASQSGNNNYNPATDVTQPLTVNSNVPAIAGDINNDGKITFPEIAGDKDGDGKITFPEIAGDNNGDGKIEKPEIVGDTDGDGTIDDTEVTGDTNGDGKITAPEVLGDKTGDGTPDVPSIAGDTNGDGKITTPEIAGDTNGDGKITLPEIAGDTNGDGKITTPEVAGDTNGDGKITASEIAGDTNGDGKTDGTEIAGDTDGDGKIDGNEVTGDTNGDGNITVPEVLGDQTGDGTTDVPYIAGDTNGDGKVTTPEIAGDTNGDGKIIAPEIAGDTNGDGKIDGTETAGDTDGDGKIDDTEVTGDTDGDGKIDGTEVLGDKTGDGTTDVPHIAGDTNGDGKITTPEIAGDINGDGKVTTPEIAGDTDGDGIIDGTEVTGDTDGDGKIDGTEVLGDQTGDGTTDVPYIAGDTNGDGKVTTPEIAGDINGDGKVTTPEIAGDTDGDGKIDDTEVTGDTDGDGKIDGTEVLGDQTGDGSTDVPSIAGDTNGDGKITAPEIAGDNNGDGRIGGTEIAGDTNGDGTIGGTEIAGDTNGDGTIGGTEIAGDKDGDRTIAGTEITGDTNGDGQINSSEIAGDKDGDHSISGAEIVGDTNGDGSIGSSEIAGDTNGDGQINLDEVHLIDPEKDFPNINNLFTPNSDGINDYWKLPEIETYGIVEVTVYNRYGQPVYRSDNYKNDWDGTWDGYPLPSASYYYIIKSSELGFIKGVVNIVR